MKYLLIVFAIALTGRVGAQPLVLNCDCGHRYEVLWDGWVPDSTNKVHHGHAEEGYGYVYRCKKPTENEMMLCLKVFLISVGRKVTRLHINSIAKDDWNSYLGWSIIWPIADGINNINFKQ